MIRASLVGKSAGVDYWSVVLRLGLGWFGLRGDGEVVVGIRVAV